MSTSVHHDASGTAFSRQCSDGPGIPARSGFDHSRCDFTCSLVSTVSERHTRGGPICPIYPLCVSCRQTAVAAASCFHSASRLITGKSLLLVSHLSGQSNVANRCFVFFLVYQLSEIIVFLMRAKYVPMFSTGLRLMWKIRKQHLVK